MSVTAPSMQDAAAGHDAVSARPGMGAAEPAAPASGGADLIDPAMDFDYKPMSMLATASLVVGILSVVSFIGITALAVPVAGILLSLLALWQIRASRGQLIGATAAVAALLCSSGFLVAGASYQAVQYVYEVPEGHIRLRMNWLAEQGLIYEKGKYRVSPEVAALDGKKVYVKGYMYPGVKIVGITEFTMCKDTLQCCFGGQPQPTDMIFVTMKPGVTATHRDKLLAGVAGTFRVKNLDDGLPLGAIYTVEADLFR